MTCRSGKRDRLESIFHLTTICRQLRYRLQVWWLNIANYSLFLFSSTFIRGGTIFSFLIVAGLKIIYSPPSYSS